MLSRASYTGTSSPCRTRAKKVPTPDTAFPMPRSAPLVSSFRNRRHFWSPIVCPGQSQVIALPPEYIMPQDGHAKQDCERAAGKRWLAKHAAQVAPHGITFLGDDLYSNQPFCALVLHNHCNFIFTCKPDSHPKFYERVAFWQA